MFFIFFTLFFFAILAPLVLGIIIPIYKKHKESTGGIINYDCNMRKFVYKVDLSSENIIKTLKSVHDTDELSCAFDADRNVITFSEYGSNRKYYFKICEYDSFSIFMLEQVDLIGMQSHIPYKLNPFMVNKLNAEIIPFSQYSF